MKLVFGRDSTTSTKPRKPPHGASCNGCGQCCEAVLGPLGTAIFLHEDGPCPAIERTETGFCCGLVLHPERYSPVRAAVMGKDRLSESALVLIGAGKGCDGQLEGEPADEAFRRRLIAYADKIATRILRAKEAWGITAPLGRF